MARILVIEDNDTMREGMVAIIGKMGHECDAVSSGQAGLALSEKKAFDLIVTDYRMEGMDGLEVLKQSKLKAPGTEVLIITAYGTIELAVEAMKLGAVDFITKPFSHDEFKLKIERILERIQERKELARISDENIYLRDELEEQFNYGEIIGKSRAMQEVYRTIEKVAATDSSVLIYGESGTGKELVARAIHKLSPRKDKPFIRVNCGALVENLLESELFGHEKGAFTGAMKRKKGRFELAHQGSIFLDEIGDISPNMQLKLLRVLQEKEFERVGSEETIQVDVRILAATNKNLSELVQQGKFREDLYYRLHIIPIYLPPLRERKEDIPLLVQHFIKQLAAELKKPAQAITDAAMEKLINYPWPGNVRELENVIERAIVLSDKAVIDAADLPILPATGAERLPGDLLDRFGYKLNETLAAVEKQLIEKAMNETQGNKNQAAKLLGIGTSLLYYKLEKYGIISN
ncbi:MAG: sigma-54 dependent transcriptional regulator [candidate division KSB1 bacterium]|nr:sigma-54 dependent transcriptional regulator [candidate division KSB1 bacterium]